MAVELIAVASDIHFPYHDVDAWGAFRLWHKDHRPNMTAIIGDFLDFPSISRYPQGIGAKTNILPELRVFIDEANALRKEAGCVSVVVGNHEDRYYKKVLEPIAQHIEGLNGLSLEEQCRFQGLHKSIKWFTESASWRGLKVGQFTLRHGHHQSGRFGSEAPARSALTKGMYQSVVFGHHHVIQMHVASNPEQGTAIAIANGHFQDLKSVNYNLNNTWSHGFTVLELNTKTNIATPYPVIIQNGKFVYHRKVYG